MKSRFAWWFSHRENHLTLRCCLPWISSIHCRHSSLTSLTSLFYSLYSVTDGIQRWCSKHTAGMCAVGKVLLDRKQADNDHCPLCGKSEDHRHVPRCGDKRACKEWNSRVDEFIQWSTNFGTAPEINIAFKHCLRQIREPAHQWAPEEIPGQVIPHHLIHQAYGLQSMIGPQGFLEGLLSCKWANAQERYFAFKGSRRSGRKWASQVAHQLIKIGFHMWEHRNQVFHSDESIGNKRLGEKIDMEIRQQFSTDPSNLSAAARYDLRNSIGRILKRSPGRKNCLGPMDTSRTRDGGETTQRTTSSDCSRV